MPTPVARARDVTQPPTAWRRWLPRTLWTLAIVAAVVWSLEPWFRREVLFEQPVVLRTGTEVRGAFVPNLAAYRTYVDVRFPEAGLTFTTSAADAERKASTERLELAVGRPGARRSPAGLRVSTEIRVGGQLVLEATGGGDGCGTLASSYAGMHLASFRANAEVEHSFVVRVEHADPALARFQARLVVANGGDWWNYRVLEQTFRPMLAAAALLLAAFVAWLARLPGRRRASTRP